MSPSMSLHRLRRAGFTLIEVMIALLIGVIGIVVMMQTFAVSEGFKRPATSEADTAAVARKSLIAGRDLKAGQTLTEHDLAAKRPGTGLPPSLRPFLVGRVLARDVPAGTVVTLDMIF